MSHHLCSPVAILSGVLLSTAVGCSPPSKPTGGSSAVGTRPNTAAAATAPTTSAGAMKAAAVRVVRKSLVRSTEQPGEVEPFETTPLFAKIAGYVDEVKKDIGDPVSVGETLAVLKAPEMLDDLKQKESLVAQARAGIVQAGAGLKVAEAMVEKARAAEAELQAGVDRTTADLTRWNSELERIRELSKQGAVTTKLLEETQNKRDAAAAALAEARAKFRSAAAEIAEADARVVQAKADLEAAGARNTVAEAARDAAKQMTDYLKITSPYAGFVTERHVDTGHFVSPAASGSGKPLFVVVRADRLRIVVNVPEFDAQYVTPGDKATVRLQALGDRVLSDGVAVARSALKLDPASGTLRTEIDLDNKKFGLRPGLYANVAIELDRRDGALVLPTTALFPKDGKTACVVVVDGKASLRFVQKGLSAGAEVEILPSTSLSEGVQEGDLVVAKNAATIADGQALEGVETPPAK